MGLLTMRKSDGSRGRRWLQAFGRRAAVAALGLAMAAPGAAETLRVGLGTDAATMDPHAVNIGATTLVLRQIYEPLVGRSPSFEREPALAVEWSNPEPTRWLFRLRPGVRFHDGSPFDADDVVFSLGRSREGISDFRLFTSTVAEIRKLDPLTVEIVTSGIDPVLPDKLSRVFIMDREWATRHNTMRPQDFRNREASYAAFHANGTGPYRLTKREPGGRTEMEQNAAWWGHNESGVEAVTFLPITADAPRVAALLAGEADLIVDVPPQLAERIRRDQRLRLIEKPENRTVFLGMDQARDELLGSDIKGRNPLKDRRVRQAMSLAIDAQAIHSTLMQGHSVPTALLWAPPVFGYAAEDDVRPPVDTARARQLLQDAGYPAGFAVTLDCPRDRYVNDERICQAVGAQLARIGVRVTVNVMPFNLYVGKLQRAETSFYLLGWATPTYDTYVTLQALVRTRGQGADGTNNFGNYSNPMLDALIDRIKFEADFAERYRLVREAGRMIRDDVAYIPLHHQTIMWAMRANIEAVLPPENQLDVKWVRIRK